MGTWPPVLGLFKATMDAGKLAEDLKTSTGESWKIEKVRGREGGAVWVWGPWVLLPSSRGGVMRDAECCACTS